MTARKLTLAASDPTLLELLRAEFWKDVYKTDGCWAWCGREDRQGYGVFSYRHHITREWFTFSAHRLGYLLQHGRDPGELFVCHHCDNPRCIRGDHLFLGDAEDNAQDYSKKLKARQQRRSS